MLSAGDHVPTMPFKEVAGRGDSKVPAHTGPTGAKAGTTLVPRVDTVIVVVAVQPLASFTVMV